MSPVSVKQRAFSDKIKLISVNANGFRAREGEIRRFLGNQAKNCIMAISDTKLKEETDVREIEGYTMLRMDKKTTNTIAPAGGVALIIPKSWSCQQVNLTSTGDHYEAIAVILLPPDQNSRPFKLICIYNHPGHYFPEGIFSDFRNIGLNGKEIGGFVVGDMNCPHAAFGSRTENEFGRKLLQNLNQENLIYHDCQSPTYISNSTGLANVLDLVISDFTGSQLVESCQIGNDIGSDHLPIVTRLSFRSNPVQKTKTNLIAWAQTVDERLQKFAASDDIDQNIERISDIFQKAKFDCTRTFTPKYKRNLPEEIHCDIRLRKLLLKNRKRATSEISQKVLTKLYNRVNHRVQQKIRDFDEREMQKVCENICNADSTYKMWRFFNKHKNDNKPIEEPEAPLTRPNGLLTCNNKEKCDEFARYLNTVHQTPDNPLFDRDYKKEIDEEISREQTRIEENSIRTIHIPQFDKLLSETKTNSAPGDDGITYDVLKMCSSATKQILCNLINQCASRNVFPNAWKEAKVRMVPKPGRDKKLASNYRPISLLSCLGKIYERFIYAYLMKELEAKNFLNANQAGFTKGRSSQEHLLRLSQGVFNGFKRRDCSLALFLDVKAAFDAVWKSGLKHKINKIGLSRQMKNILFSFLDNRTLKVCIDGCWSEVVELRAGTPQGSCISPILYLIYVNDMTDVLDLTRVSASQYADDAGMWTTCSTVREAESTLQREVDKLEEWCRKWQVTLSPHKSKLILFTKCPRHKDEVIRNNVSINLFGEGISLSEEAEFLGVTLDTRLTWEPQTRKIVSKSYKRLNLLRAVSAMSNTLKPDVIVKLYKSTIRSLFEYSSLCIINAAECHMKKLQLIQNQALRVILRTPAYVSIDDLHDCSGIPRIKDHIKEFARKRFLSMEYRSPLIGQVIDEYSKVKHITENASALDMIYT